MGIIFYIFWKYIASNKIIWRYISTKIKNWLGLCFTYTANNIAEKLYGDSFTAWQQWWFIKCLIFLINLGVGGYGLDQSILKFEKILKETTNVKNIILGLNNQVYGRSVSYYSYYYFFNKYFKYAFKPMFIKTDNEFELLKIPCIDSDCLKR